MSEYQAQKEILEAHSTEDVFVASYKVFQDEKGVAHSQSVWSKGVLTLLPRTDRVGLNLDPGGQGAEVFFVPWDVLVEAAGDLLLQEPRMDPPRWRTVDWPAEDAIRKLRVRAVR